MCFYFLRKPYPVCKVDTINPYSLLVFLWFNLISMESATWDWFGLNYDVMIYLTFFSTGSFYHLFSNPFFPHRLGHQFILCFTKFYMFPQWFLRKKFLDSFLSLSFFFPLPKCNSSLYIIRMYLSESDNAHLEWIKQ